MDTLLAKLPLFWRLAFWVLVTIAIPGAVSFTVLETKVGQIQEDLTYSQLQSKEYRIEAEAFRNSIQSDLKEIQRSIGRVEGKLDGRR